MAEFAAPSFSLGLDFDLDSEPQEPTVREDPSSSSHQAANPSAAAAAAANLRTFDYEDDDFETPPTTIGRDLEDLDPPRSLKRLRRGLTNDDTSVCEQRKLPERWCGFEDEIEEFSSQEDRPTADQPPSTVHHSVCGSSKVQLHGHRVLTTQSSKKMESISKAPSSMNIERSSIKLTFPKLTTSPLRRFQLIDSDDDETSVSEGANLDSIKSVLSSKQRQSGPTNHASATDGRGTYAAASVSRAEDLWQDFCPEKDFHIPTPALDEVCEEYFGSMRYNKAIVPNNTNICNSGNISYNLEQQLDFAEPLPPAHHYFFHDDLRIQELVRSRLPNFFPLGVMNNRGNRQPTTSDIDYMGQFNHGESSKQTSRKTKATTCSTRSKKNSTRSNAEEVSLGWINPKLGVAKGNPKVAGKRRVQADGQSAGRWFMGPNGKRVYVNKNGQELMGQMAYRQYKKESGTGFKKPKKKRNAKKKK